MTGTRLRYEAATGAEFAAARMGLLRTTLDGLVPLYMWQLHGRGDMEGRAGECVDVIASHGDDLEHGRETGGEALNAVARAIAILALVNPTGVSVFGGHWCRDHRECGAE